MKILDLRAKFIEVFKEYKPKLCGDSQSNPQYYQAFPIAGISAIHYELIQRMPDGPVFLEFHMERSHYWEYDDIAKEYIALFKKPENYRDCDFWTSYSSLFWRMRRPIFTEADFEEDATRLKEIVLSSKGLVRTDESNEGTSAVWIRNVTPAKEVLGRELNIPEYQRPYCWEKKNILGLLNDIARWQAKHPGQLYHIGTIVLKECVNGKYDIIDGQQRLITLALTFVAQGNSPPKFTLGQNNTTNSA